MSSIHKSFPSRTVAYAVMVLVLALVMACTGTPNADAAQEGLKVSTPTKVATTSASNVKNKANSATIFRYGHVNLNNYRDVEDTTSSYDVTGDALPDAITVNVVPRGETGLFDAISIRVNDAQVYVANAPTSGFDQATVCIITLRNNKPFLYVSAYAANGNASQALFQYGSGKLHKVVGNDFLQRNGTSNACISSIRPSANRVIVQYDFVSTMTGLTRTSFTYMWKDGSLVRKDSTTSALRFATKATGGYTKQKRKTVRALVAYANSALTRKAFVIPAGKSIRPLGLRLTESGLVYKLRFGKKTGWVKCPGAGECKSGFVLAGTYGCIPLASEAPAYSSKAIGLATLQRYGNHALFIARNEVYARHGLSFGADELKAHFSAQSWYAPRSGKVSLSKVEMKNVLLMLAIEKHRRSPYV